MREFKKGTIITVVSDDDKRINDYLANGWMETKTAGKQKDAADKRMEKAIADANESESKGSKKKNSAADKKVNDALKAAAVAAEESVAVDDGLIKQDGGKNNG